MEFLVESDRLLVQQSFHYRRLPHSSAPSKQNSIVFIGDVTLPFLLLLPRLYRSVPPHTRLRRSRPRDERIIWPLKEPEIVRRLLTPQIVCRLPESVLVVEEVQEVVLVEVTVR